MFEFEFEPGFTAWSPDVIHAIFLNPASSNLFAAPEDLNKKKQQNFIYNFFLFRYYTFALYLDDIDE